METLAAILLKRGQVADAEVLLQECLGVRQGF